MTLTAKDASRRTRDICAPILEKLSGLTLNRDFFLGYSPERANPMTATV